NLYYYKGNDLMSHNKYIGELKKKRNYRLLVITLSNVMIVTIGILSLLVGYEDIDALDVKILLLMSAIFYSFTFIFLVIALIAILNKKVKIHLGFIYAAFTTTFLFLITYVTFHFLAPSTPFGGSGAMAIVYYFVLITHIVLAAAIVPLALTSITRAW